MSWYSESLRCINDVINKKGWNKVTIKDIDKAYPFGERKRFPYKMWLKARKEKLISLGLYQAKKDKEDMGLFKNCISKD